MTPKPTLSMLMEIHFFLTYSAMMLPREFNKTPVWLSQSHEVDVSLVNTADGPGQSQNKTKKAHEESTIQTVPVDDTQHKGGGLLRA